MFETLSSELDFTDVSDMSYFALECAAVADNFETFQLLQLCENTRRRIAARGAPKAPREWKGRLAEEGIEAKLLREAMLEEVMWLINQGKVRPVLE